MRSCIYCGRTLEKGEKCNCPQSVKARQAKEASGTKSKASEQANTSSDTWANNVYATGYTQKEKRRRPSFKKFFKKFKLPKLKMPNLKLDFLSFLKDPVGNVQNPKNFGKGQTLAIVIIQSLVIALGVFLMGRRVTGSVMNYVQMFGFLPENAAFAFPKILNLSVFAAITSAILTFVMFFVFWAIDRMIFKRRTSFWVFSERLAAASEWIVFCGLAAIVLGIFSAYAFLMIAVIGGIMWLALVYEALACQWSFASRTKVLYLMSCGMFFVLVIGFNILMF